MSEEVWSKGQLKERDSMGISEAYTACCQEHRIVEFS